MTQFGQIRTQNWGYSNACIFTAKISPSTTRFSIQTFIYKTFRECHLHPPLAGVWMGDLEIYARISNDFVLQGLPTPIKRAINLMWISTVYNSYWHRNIIVSLQCVSDTVGDQGVHTFHKRIYNLIIKLIWQFFIFMMMVFSSLFMTSYSKIRKMLLFKLIIFS